MSLLGTLAKVAIGIAVAKGVGGMLQKAGAGQSGGGSAGGSDGRFGGAHSPRGQSGDLGSVMDDILKGTPGGTSGGVSTGSQESVDPFGNAGPVVANDPTGGLGGASGGALGGALGGASGGGGLGGILDQLSRAAAGGSGGASGGLGGILGQLTGAAKGGGGGLGDLLGGLLGVGAAGAGAARSASGGGSFGDLLNQSLANGGEPAAPPAPEHEAMAAVLLSAMIQAAKADGRIDDAEKKKLTDSLGQADDAEMAFVRGELAKPIDVAGLCAQVPEGAQAQVYGMSLMAIDLDNQLEAKYLDSLANGLALDKQAVNAIHAHMGVRSLYS